jgi:spore coat polysaccharide biosynthesis protein SpsF (cytidylyltransferase family)
MHKNLRNCVHFFIITARNTFFGMIIPQENADILSISGIDQEEEAHIQESFHSAMKRRHSMHPNLTPSPKEYWRKDIESQIAARIDRKNDLAINEDVHQYLEDALQKLMINLFEKVSECASKRRDVNSDTFETEIVSAPRQQVRWFEEVF